MNDPIELAAIDRGAGTPVVMVHGGIIHAAPAWAKNLGAVIENGYRALAVDRRGHGRSEGSEAEWVPVHLHADDLRLTLELREATPCHLVAVSYGCLVALEFALSWPERVVSMTLLEPPLFTWFEDDPDYKVWYESFIKIADEAVAGAPLEDWLPRWLSLIDARMAKATNPQWAGWKIVERQAPLIFKEEAGWEYRPDEDRLGKLDIPTLVLSGDQSEPPMQVLAQRLAEKLPRAEHRWIPGGGHDCHAGKADEFNELMLMFLSRHDPVEIDP